MEAMDWFREKPPCYLCAFDPKHSKPGEYCETCASTMEYAEQLRKELHPEGSVTKAGGNMAKNRQLVITPTKNQEKLFAKGKYRRDY